MLSLLNGLGGGAGGFAPSTSANTGPVRGGEIGGAVFNPGSINTGTQSIVPTWVWIAGIAVAGLVALRMIRRA